MITLKKTETGEYNLIMGKTKQDVVPLKDMITNDVFPKKPKIRIIGTNDEEAVIRSIITDLNSSISPQSYVANIPVNSNDANFDGDGESNNSIKELIHQMSTINDREKWIDFLEKTRTTESEVEYMMMGFINEPELMRIDFENSGVDNLSKDIVQKIKTRNDKIEKALQEYADVHAQHHGENHKIILKHMKWDYVMCYGPNNYFNFETSENKICLLNGRNAIGKTAFLDVIFIGLYGEPSKQRKMISGKKMGGKMLHDHRPDNVSMSVNLLFTLNDEYYEIYRSFTKQGRGDAGKEDLRQMNAVISTVNIQTKVKTIICEGVVTVDAWIEKKFGTIDDVLMSTFVSQTETNNFFHLKQEDQKAIYDKAVHLESIAAFGQVLKESLLAHNDIITMINNSNSALNEVIQTKKNNGGVKDLGASLQSQIDKYTGEYAVLEEAYKKCTHIVGDFEPKGEDATMDASSVKKLLNKNVQKLATLGTITEADKKKAVLIEGEQNISYITFQKEKARVGEPLMEGVSRATLETMIQTLQTDIEKHDKTRPERQLSPELLAKQCKELKEWEDEQDTDWFENPDGLETQMLEFIELKNKYEKKYEECIQNSIQKPRITEIDANGKKFIASKEKWTLKDLTQLQNDCNELRIKMNTLLKSQVIPCRDESGFKKWRTEYTVWKNKVIGVIGDEEGSEEETCTFLEERYKHLQGYITIVEEKIAKKAKSTNELNTLQKEKEELDKYEFNPECYACQKQPMRIRFNDLSTQETKVIKDLQKIEVSLKKYTATFDLESSKEELKELAQKIELRRYYEQTRDDKETENAAWTRAQKEWKKVAAAKAEIIKYDEDIAEYTCKIGALENYLWGQWQKKEQQLKQYCSDINIRITRAQHFIKGYEEYIKKQRFLDEETTAHDLYAIWDEKYTAMTNQLAEYTIEMERKIVDAKLIEWQSKNNMRVDLIEKIRAFENLEKAIQQGERMLKYIEMQKIAEQKSGIDKKLKEVSHDLVRYQKEEEDNKGLLNSIAVYEKYATLLARRKEALGILECRFIGEKNGNEGYKEYIYKNHVIPLIEKEINQFLSLIDPLRLQITYADKSFQYMVKDRGNTPMLAMCSGYQKFIIGIALRLALSRIGATGQNIRHFFIDEGFVACDAFNLEKVQSMLRKMMEYGEYVNIILMSHLEAIRDAADMSVDITREGYFSKIHWGTLYPTLSKAVAAGEETKKAGRPSKSKAAAN
jgi:DNA repair exonuclease SbcCD ATPase subunit